jgi:hypothetical protein
MREHLMGIFNLFQRAKPAVAVRLKSAPFVITLDGQVYSDTTGKISHHALSNGAKDVLAAGRWVIEQGSVLVITNESPTYQTSLAQMQSAVAHLASIGLGLDGGGKGVLVVIYSGVDEAGNGIGGERFRVVNSAAGVNLVLES